jgi:phospholipid-transporting ATPase
MMAKKRKSDLREIKVKGQEKIIDSIYAGNKLNLSRYTFFTLIPKNLFEQFQRSSNIWFLVVSIFQLIPMSLNPTDSWTTILPLSILLLISLVKDAYLDYKLKLKDKAINNQIFSVWDGQKFVKSKSEDLLVSQFVIVKEHETVPVDMIIITSKNQGNIFLDMSKLLGITNLSLKTPLEKTSRLVSLNVETPALNKVQGKLLLPEPNSDYTSFNGTFMFEKIPGGIEINANNVLYRGGVLRGEEAVLGITAYCGQETKLQLNTNTLKIKLSRIEQIVNTWVLYILSGLTIVVLFSVIGFYYIGTRNSSQYNFIEPFITFTLLYNNIIPISLFLAIDIVRIAQSWIFIRGFKYLWFSSLTQEFQWERLTNNDLDSVQAKNIRFNNVSVNENLGQVDYIVTDKTGTLTSNKLVLKSCVIGDKRFELNLEAADTEPLDVETNPMLLNISERRCSTSSVGSFSQLKDLLLEESQSSINFQFLKCIAMCNDLSYHNDMFLGSSSEEIAMVEGCKNLGFTINISQKNIFELSQEGSNKNYYRIIASTPFTSEKKNSRILLEESGSTGILFVKGSLKNMLPLLNISDTSQYSLKTHVANMREKGLRTIVLACKKIKSEEILEIKSKIQRIKKSLLNPSSRIESMFKDLEKNMKYLGVAGLSEILLPDVVDTIKILKESGIKIWMASSDSHNNTILVAKQSDIIAPYTKIVEFININNIQDCSRELVKAAKALIFVERDADIPNSPQTIIRRRSRINDDFSSDPFQSDALRPNGLNLELFRSSSQYENEIPNTLKKPFTPPELDYAIIIDKTTWQVALNDLDCRKLLVAILVCAKTVCFVDLMPSDKGNVVSLLRENVSFKPLVACIGSGEGDISMLQTGDIGIGIINGEDSLVLNYSDIVINSFNQLNILVLALGHWNYARISKLILLFLYKNCFLTIVLLTFTFYCNFSGTSIFNAALLLGFNLFFTSLPLLIIGVFDEDISYDKILKNNSIYSIGINNLMFEWKNLCTYLIIGILQGVILIILTFVGFPAIINPSGHTEDMNILGTVIYITLVLAVLLQIHLEIFCYSLLYFLSQLASIVLLIVFLIVISDSNSTPELIDVGRMISSSPISLFTIFMNAIACVTPVYITKTYTEVFNTSKLSQVKASYSIENSGVNKLDAYSHQLGSLYSNSSNWNNKLSLEKFSMNKYTLEFKLHHIERKFRDNFIRENILMLKWTFILLWALLALWVLFGSLLINESTQRTLFRVFICVGSGLIVIWIWNEKFKKHYRMYILLISFGTISIKFVVDMIYTTGILSTGLIASVGFLILNVSWLPMLLLNVLNSILFIISISIEYGEKYSSTESGLLSFQCILLIISITLTSAIVGYFLEHSKRVEYKLLNKAHGGLEKVDSIMSMMLPSFISARVKEGVRYIAEDQGEVTILFCDICDFDRICKDYNHIELTAFLDKLFSCFDELCENLGVTKIETVGKTYMACAGLKDSEKDLPGMLRKQPHARRAIELAFGMIQEVKTIQLKNGNGLQVKIGINTGTVAAGVVGYHKPQFSLVGDTVNTASRMCSTLELANNVQVSVSTYEFIKDYPDLEFTNRIVEAKGKGDVLVYIVNESKLDNSDVAGGIINLMQSNPNLFNNPSTLTDGQTEEAFSKTELYRKKRSSKLWKQDLLKKKDSHLIEFSPLMKIKFTETDNEKEFRIHRLEKNYKAMTMSLIIATSTFLLITIIAISEYYKLNGYASRNLLIIRACVVFFLLVILFLHPRIYKKLYYTYIIVLCLVLMLVAVMVELSECQNIPTEFIGLEVMYIVLILYHISATSLPAILIFNILIFIPWIILTIFNSSYYLNFTNIILVAGFSGINFKAMYTQEKNDRTNRNLSLLSDKETADNEALLKQMMPPHVLEKLEKGEPVTDRLLQVTIIFADIVGFTAWSSNKTPEEVVKMLSNLFTRFDKLCLEFDVYKVHTIGDCYVVMGDVGKKKRDPSKECLNVMKTAYRMIEIIKEENYKHNSNLNMRIGVHTGEVIAGVIGTNIIRYDIWGPDVLIANKMESNGTPGRVKVSENTKMMIESRSQNLIVFEDSNQVEIHSIGASKNTFYAECVDMDALDAAE